MKKFLSVILVLCAIVLVFTAVSCKKNPTPTPTPTPTRAATLEVYSFKNYYPVGATTANLVGTLVYTDTNAKVTTIDIKDSAVTTNFDGTTAGEGKILKITYQGIDTTTTYNVVKVEDVDIAGTFILGKNVSYCFSSGSTTVKKETWTDWGHFTTLDLDPEVSTTSYTVTISPTGRTTIRLDDWTYSPDGKGGLYSYPSEGQYFEFSNGYIPNTNYFYVSTTKEDDRSITNDAARDKYLVMLFMDNGDAKVWFTDDLAAGTLAGLNDGNKAYTIAANKMIFDNSGVYFKGVTADATKGKNLAIYLNKDGYASTDRAFSFVSSTGVDDNYKGYSYIMKLTAVAPTP